MFMAAMRHLDSTRSRVYRGSVLEALLVIGGLRESRGEEMRVS